MLKSIFAATAALLCAGIVFADIDRKNFDPTVKPADDFYHYVNGAWLKNNPIPPEQSQWAAFTILHQNNQKNLRQLAEDAAAASKPTAIQQIVGDFYTSGMDEAAIEAAGIKPLASELARIDALKTPEDVLAQIAHLHLMGIGAGFSFGSEPDAKDSDMEIAVLSQGGLGLPDRDYYTSDDDKTKAIREQYAAHLARMFVLAGEEPAAAAAGAKVVLKLETTLAGASLTRVALRDPYASYHKMPLTDLQKYTGDLDWAAYFHDVGTPTFTSLDLAHPDFYKAFAVQLKSTSVADWQVYLRSHLLRAAAPYLSSPFVNEHFAFYDTVLSGTKALKPRWQRVVTETDSDIGEALGQLYVARYFPPEAKARVLELVANLRAALRARLQTLDWMDEPTRAKAVGKLDAFTVKMGYPDKWRDYSSLAIDRGPYVLNVFRANTFEVRRQLAKIGKPVDKTEWEMSPPTVNAYYSPSFNGVAFPAGILQPPFFDPKADDPVNYGAIGAVIGHEMTHGFDDEGRQFDAQGNLTDWWSPESAARFKERSAAIVKQFSSYTPLPGVHINGDLTQGENIADLGGVKISYAALQKALEGKPHASIDGFTPEQRFFLSFASIWRNNIRPEALRLRLNTDPHSPGEFRVNGPLSNLEDFAAAFDIPAGAPMRRPASERVNIW